MLKLTKKPGPLDVALGARIRAKRTAAGISQTELAAAIHVTFQQIQKYEKGQNRLSFGRTVRIAGALKISLAELAGDLVPTAALPALSRRDAWLDNPEAHELLEAFSKIKSRKQRASLVDVARSMAMATVA